VWRLSSSGWGPSPLRRRTQPPSSCTRPGRSTLKGNFLIEKWKVFTSFHY
jgi:hypothetical protein